MLIESQKPGAEIEEAKEAEDAALQAIIDSIIADPTVQGVNAKGRILAEKTGMTTSAAQMRIRRARNKPTIVDTTTGEIMGEIDVEFRAEPGRD